MHAVLVGGSAGIALACVAGLLFLVSSGASTPFSGREVLISAAMVLMALPATLIFGALIAYPLSAILVFALTKVARRWRILDHPLVWLAAGAILAAPLTYLLHDVDTPHLPFRFTIASWCVVGVGAGAAYAAWRVRPGRVDCAGSGA